MKVLNKLEHFIKDRRHKKRNQKKGVFVLLVKYQQYWGFIALKQRQWIRCVIK